MIEVDVKPGICGMPSRIRVHSEDGQHARVEITSDCPSIQKLADVLDEVDAYAELYNKEGIPPMYYRIREHCKHAACPVPVALLKGIEAAIGTALPGDVEIRIRKVED
jgi:hypothetical protein